MANRKAILNQLKVDLSKIQSGRGYFTDPVEIVHGIMGFDDFVQRPAISFVMIGDEKDQEYYDDNRLRNMSVYLYGFADVQLNNYDPIYDLAEDMETFLYSTDWTYTDNTLLGDVVITPGGTDNMRALCDTIIMIKYCQEL
jgi:hypothetical protein